MSTERGRRSRNAPSGFLRAATNLLFPTRCVACRDRAVENVGAGAVCDACWRTLPRREKSLCARCDDPLPAAEASVCGRCQLDPPPFRRLRAAVPYRGSARAILIAFKFRRAPFLAPHLARLMQEALGDDVPAYREVVPVPATPGSRLRSDHAADLLADAVAGRLCVPYAPRRLRKLRRTKRQSGLPGDRRRSNVRGAFESAAGAPDRVLLVDDVATSGSTARECAAALRSAGAREVDVLCFARATRDDEIAEASEIAGAPRRALR